MPNLPMKQSRFSKIRSNILEMSLRNDFTRGIVVNFLPQVFGYNIMMHVRANDTKNFDKTVQLLASMNEGTLKANFENFTVQLNSVNDRELKNEIINKILDSLNSNMQKVFATEFIKFDRHSPDKYSNDLLKRVVDVIHFDKSELNEVRNLLSTYKNQPFPNMSIPFYVFSDLTQEQKKDVFSDIISIFSSKKDYITDMYLDLDNIFSQFEPENRLEQFNKILEFYQSELQEKNNPESTKSKNQYKEPNLTFLSSCFGILSKEEKLSKLEETLEILKLEPNQNKKRRSYSQTFKFYSS